MAIYAYVSIKHCKYEERLLTTITAPFVNLPHRCFAVDVIDTLLSSLVLLVSTQTVDLMLPANVYSCPKVHEVVDVVAVLSDRPKFLNQLGFQERFQIVDRPREAPEGDVILSDQPSVVK